MHNLTSIPTVVFNGISNDLSTRRQKSLVNMIRVSFLSVIATLICATGFSQINGTKTVGATGFYQNLTTAFAAIASSGVNGNIILSLTDDYPGVAETFPLSCPTSAVVGAFTVTVRPGASPLAITGNSATGLINFNGSQNIIFDGRLNGAGTNNDLTITNNSIIGTAYVAQFINDASNNTIKYCTVKGGSAATTNGVIAFLTTTGTSGTSGNNNNTISNCTISNNSSGTPFYSIYSVGTAAYPNINNTITNCNIENFYNAAGASRGISIGAGNSAWIITGNSLYQTVSRTPTAAANSTHAGIYILSGVNHTITGNYIGGSGPLAAGTWNYSGTSFLSIWGILVAGTAGTASSIQNNIITNITLSTAYTSFPVFAGVYINAGSANVGTTAANTVGSTTGTGAINVTCSFTSSSSVFGMMSVSTGTVNFSNNNIAGITVNGSSTAVAVSLTGIMAQGGSTGSTITVSGNTIGSLTVPNSLNAATVATSGSQLVRGIDIQSTMTGPAIITNNNVANINQASTTTGANLRGIVYSGTGGATITGNNVNNLTGAGSIPPASTSQGAVAGIVGFASAPIMTITDNTIFKIIGTNAAASQYYVLGIVLSNATAATILRNKIYDVRNASTMVTATTPSRAVGIQYVVSGAAYTLANNMIALGQSQTNDMEFIGIWNNNFSAAGVNVYYNSIYISGTATSSTLPSFAFCRGSNGGGGINTPVDIRDNILWNARTSGAGTGKNYAIGNQSNSPATGWGVNASNFNVLNGTAATIGLWNITDYTFAGWKSISASDASSITNAVVAFTNAAAGDLHINLGTTGTQIESAGTAISGYTTDYDLETRPGGGGTSNGGGTGPDLGADEFNGVILDNTDPAISYTLVTNTSGTSSRVLNSFATITDLSGINGTLGTRPRLYYKRSTDANTFNDNTSGTTGWKYDEANNAVSPFSFTLNYSILSGGTGVTAGTTIQYFVVAQDMSFATNVGINSGTFAANPSSVNLTSAAFPIAGTINTYTIVPAYSGILNVGTTQTITSLTNTGGLFDLLNNGALTGNMVVNITSNLTGELGTVALNQLAEDGAGNYTVLIKPTAAYTISGASSSAVNSALIKLNGADRITIDGSTSGGTDRSLTITNTNTTGATVTGVIWLASASGINGATGNTIKNCIIKGNTTNTSTYSAISCSGTTSPVSTAATSNSNNTFQNNAISATIYGIYLSGPTGIADAGNTIINNSIGSTVAASKHVFAGIYAFTQSGITISNNTVTGVSYSTTSATTAMVGILLGGASTNGTITRNRVTDIKNSLTGGSQGICLRLFGTAANIVVANNMVSDVASAGSGTVPTEFNNGTGIFISSGGGVKLYYNSVNLVTNQTTVNGVSGAFGVAAAVTAVGGLEVRNNIFATAQTAQTRFAIINGAAANVFSIINNNDYYTTAGGILGYQGGNVTTLAAWKTATGQDANSINVNPQFNTPTNLAPTAGSPVLGAGTPVSITTDIIGTTRSGTAPSIGAYEASGDFAPPAITFTTIDNTCSTASQTIVATITDATGTNTTATFKPRIYFKKNSGAYFSAQGVQASGNALSSTWNFTINTATLGGVTAGDIVSYYIIAQDVAPSINTGSSPAGAVATDVNTVTTLPTPYTYTVQGNLLPGTYTVGAGGTYTTLTAAIDAYNNSCLSGPVVFNLTASAYTSATETFPFDLLANPTASATNTLTIKPASGVTATITAPSSSGDVFILDGADYVTIDGSNNGTTSRNLSFISSSTTSGSDVFWNVSYGAGQGAKNNTIKNCIIQGATKGTGSNASTVVTNWGIYFGDFNGGASGPDNDNITVQNNLFLKLAIGFQAGSNTTGVLDNWIIKDNTFGDAVTTANSIGRTGFTINNAKNVTISGNTITNINITDAGTGVTGMVASGIGIGTNATNVTISKNNITGIKYTGTGSYGAVGIDINTGAAASNVIVANNTLSNIVGSGSNLLTSDATIGIRTNGATDGVQIYFNSISLGSGTFAGNANGIISAATYFGASVTGITLKDNILSTNLSNSATVNAKTYAVYSDAPSSAFTSIDYNVYSATGTQGVLGYIGSARTTIDAIRTGFGSNINSVNFAPVFTSVSDLHLPVTGNCGVDNKGTRVFTEPTDKDGVTRSLYTPDPGAYEFSSSDNQWTGTVSTNWQTATNWCSGVVPTLTSDIVIPSGTPYAPKLTNVGNVRNLSVQTGAIVTLDQYTLNVAGTLSGTGVFAGTRNAKLTLSATGAIGTLYLKSDSAILNTLSLTGTGATLTLGGATSITEKLDVQSNTLATGGFLTIKSNASSTGSVGQITTGNITGNVTVERYIPQNGFRAWRLLSVPVQGTTFHQTWQENQAPLVNGNPGFGTNITSTTGGNGFDAQTSGNSLLRFVQGNPGSWTGVTSTNNSMQTYPGYMLYIRGDRSVVPSGGTQYAGATTLRVNGPLYIGTQTATTVPSGGVNVVVGNLYASAIDFATMVKTGVNAFKVWDPKLLGTSKAGAFQTFSSANNYDPTPGGGSYTGLSSNSRIESGQAFLVSSSGGGSIQLTEAAKTSGSRNVFRSPAAIMQFKTRLYAVTKDGNELADGSTVVFNNEYSNDLDDNDISKANNLGEDLSLIVNGSSLTLETRKGYNLGDVVQYSVAKLKQQDYMFEFIPQNMNADMPAYLEDNFLKTRTLVSLSEITTVVFAITADASSAAQDRFRIVFGNKAAAPCRFELVKAVQKEKNVQVDWVVSNCLSDKYYEIEHSTDGRNYAKAGMLTALATTSASYTWLHEKPVTGANYYRIKSVTVDGESKYTNVIKVTTGKGTSGFSLYPNPVVNSHMSIEFANKETGSYTARLINSEGRSVFSKIMNHAGGTSTLSLSLPSALPSGSYQFEIMSERGERSVQNIVIGK